VIEPSLMWAFLALSVLSVLTILSILDPRDEPAVKRDRKRLLGPTGEELLRSIEGRMLDRGKGGRR
jgi:hypothetical protein